MEKRELIVVVVFTSVVLLMVAGFLLFALVWYRRRTNRYIRERDNMRNLYEKQILETRLEIQEQTLNNISREIHDGVGQELSLTKIQLNIIEVSEGLSKDVLQGAKDTLTKAIIELRDMAKSLSTERVEHFNLAISIEEELNRIKRANLLVCIFVTEGSPREMVEGKKLILFRIIQENLQNIIRHAGASEVFLKFLYTETAFEITIRDNGKGFHVEDAINRHSGLGLQNIISRSGIIGGKAEISSTIGQGTTVKIYMPYE